MVSERRRYLQSAESVRELRARLKLTVVEFATLLGVSKRTVIRGERRGLEALFHGRRQYVGDAWRRLRQAPDRAAAMSAYPIELTLEAPREVTLSGGSTSKCHRPAVTAPPSTAGDTLTSSSKPRPRPKPKKRAPRPRQGSAPRKRLRLSRDLLRARGGKNGGRQKR